MDSSSDYDKYDDYNKHHDPDANSDDETQALSLSSEHTLALASAIGQHMQSLSIRTPMRTSSLQGDTYIQEVLEGNIRRGAEVFRMPTACFRILCNWFKEKNLLQHRTRGNIPISIEQQLAMFMAIVGHSWSNRNVQERFQHSGETVHRYFYQVLDACLALYDQTIKLPLPATPSTILENRKFYPYFENCIGALDGSHFPAHIQNTQDAVRFRNRKGYLSQNVLVACTFDAEFCYILPGWEGSAHDARVLAHARSAPIGGLLIPDGYYYLADAGYALEKGVLTPYRGVRYHLREQAAAHLRPRTKEELFNLRHAQLRNIVERILGIFKRRFAIFRTAPEYPLQVQIQLVRACAALHNFIKKYCSEVEFGELDEEQEETDDRRSDMENQDAIPTEMDHEDENMKIFRDNVATSMWRDYREYNRGR